VNADPRETHDQSSSLLARLRASTREQHAQLDRGLALALPHTLTPRRYANFLAASARVLEPLEPSVERWLVLGGPSRREALRKDLAALGQSPVLTAAQTPAISTLSAAMGCGYVLEGSTLGGMALAPSVEAALGQGMTHYFRLRGSDTGAFWRSFLARLAAFDRAASEHDRAEACATASATFEAYAAAYREVGLFEPS
jgi:heme oxygenase